MVVFDKYSLYYDLLYQDKDYLSEVDYVEKLIKKYSNNKTNLLNLGCGTGKHDVLLTQKGYQITGVDLSEKMIAEANKLKKNVASSNDLNFIIGNIQNIRLHTEYDIITSLFHVMSYQISNNDLDCAFQTVKHHLKPEGVFIFDCWNGPGVLTYKPEIRVKEVSNEQYKIKRTATPVMHPNLNLVDVNYHAILLDHNNQQVDTITETHKMRYLFNPEIEFFAKKNGLQVIDNFEWMTFDTPSFDSWNAVYILKHET